MQTKDSHIQIRVSQKLKKVLQASAQRANMELSSWILSRLIPTYSDKWDNICARLADPKLSPFDSYVFADCHDLLASLTAEELEQLLSQQLNPKIHQQNLSYLASMLEYTAHIKKIKIPKWLNDIPPLDTPFFASDLISLRTHLLINSPSPYKKRNIFIDSPIGTRI